MKISQIRNATMIIHIADKVILVDPMLAPKGAIPSLKYATSTRRKNPLVDLPDQTDALLKEVTHCIITHCQKGHFDHLDKAGTKWLRENNIPVYCSIQDADFLKKKGLDVHALNSNEANPFLGGSVSLVPCVHGRGIVGKMMAHGFGYAIKLPNEPSLYITGDTILTDEVRAFVLNHKPEVVVLPAGGARFDMGGDIIMGFDEAIQMGTLTKSYIIANHLEALDHCPVTRESLKTEIHRKGWSERYFVPSDGETLTVEAV